MAPKEKADLRPVMVDTFAECVENGDNIVVVVGDSTSTCKIAPFQEKYPDRVINVGIAEQNLVGIATGLSLGGIIPFTANAAPFLISRSNEQIKNDVCYSNTNVKMVGLNAGIAYGSLASTHHSIDDISVMRGFGNVQILAPADPVETREIFRYAVRHTGPVYIRMDSAKFPWLHDDDYEFEPGKVDVLRQGTDITVCGLGSVVCEAVDAARELEKEGVRVQVLNISSIRPIDRDALVATVKATGKVVTVEEHVLTGGLGSLVAEVIAEEGLGVPFKRLGLPYGVFPKAGPRAEMRAYYGFDARGIVAAVREML